MSHWQKQIDGEWTGVLTVELAPKDKVRLVDAEGKVIPIEGKEEHTIYSVNHIKREVIFEGPVMDIEITGTVTV